MEESKAQTRLMNKAVHYLGRYTASRHRLREVLGRFATRKLGHLPDSDVTDAIEIVIEKCASFGYVDDAQFAIAQARSHRRQGRSRLGIQQRLRVHNLDNDLVAAALKEADDGLADGELLAALRYARRRRIGPYHKGTTDDPAIRKRHMGSLARAGFAMAICRQIIDLEDEIAADDLDDTLRNT